MHFADGGLLLDAEPFEEPAELLRRDALRFGRVSRPLEAPALQPFVEEQEAVPFPEEPPLMRSARLPQKRKSAGENGLIWNCCSTMAARPSMDFLMSVRPQAR